MANPLTEDLLREASALAERAEGRIQELKAERDRVMRAAAAERDQINAQISELRRYVRRVQPESRSRRRSPPRTEYRPRGELRRRIAVILLELDDGAAFSARELAGRLGVPPTSGVHDVLTSLRKLEAVRHAERRRVEGGRTPTQFWKVMDREVLERVRDENA